MHGEINVREIMEAYWRQREWWARQQLDAEWVALKVWWQAERRVARAENAQQRQEALKEQAKVVRLYRAELRRAWPKWRRVRAERGWRP